MKYMEVTKINFMGLNNEIDNEESMITAEVFLMVFCHSELYYSSL